MIIMKQYTSRKNVDETLAMPMNRFVELCKAWLDEFNGGKQLKLKNWKECPVALYVIMNGTKCMRLVVPNTDVCPVCGNPVCPDCMNHNVDQISRVTGYLATVSGFNANKKQEYLDRQRYDINVMGTPNHNVNR